MTTKKEVRRATEEMKGRLHALGVPVLPSDKPYDVVTMIEAIERFEMAVEDVGGDLMVDEPPRGSRPQPDRPDLVLATRGRGEPAHLYVERIERAAELIEREEATQPPAPRTAGRPAPHPAPAVTGQSPSLPQS